MTFKTKNIFKNLKHEINKVNNSEPITNNSKNIKPKRLVTFNEYKKHILDPKKNPLLNKFRRERYMVEANSSLQIQKNRFTLYESPKSNYQFYKIYNQSDIIYKNRLAEMLSYFTTEKDRKKIMKMISDKSTDEDIFKYLKKIFKFKKTKKDKITLYKLSKISDTIIKYTKSAKNAKNSKNEKIKILDVGVGNGKKTNIIQYLTNSKIYGADIKEWGHYNDKKKFNFPFEFINEKPYKIPYKSNMFDCITLTLTLHHADNILDVINECKRLLNDNGIIVIIEHDIWNDYDNMIIDLQHKVYNVIFNEKEHGRGDYYNFMEWDMIFYKCGMEPIYADRIVDDISFSYRYDLQFLAIYKKIQE